MNTTSTDRFILRAQAMALVALPAAWLLMFAMHFHRFTDLFVFHAQYVPVPADEKVARLIQLKNQWPMLHDPHMLGYLTLPLFVLGAFGLYSVGRRVRPRLAALGISLTVTGSIFLGGVFGLFTALTRGLGDVDPRYVDGAIATYAAVTADHEAYGMTRRLAMLAMLGIAVQAGALWRATGVPRWSPVAIVAGCAFFLRFWDVDNMMSVGTICIVAGFVPIARELLRLNVID
ncbi:MAG TPA: hypothetical protein VF277_05825 [Steroidobacteraceae bacterium]